MEENTFGNTLKPGGCSLDERARSYRGTGNVEKIL